MSVLLDTHTFFWWITGSDSLPSHHADLIEKIGETIYVSAVTGWEIAIKVKIGKWPDAEALVPELERSIADEGFELLDVTLPQAKLAGSLDLIPKDPFDRLLAAQSINLGIPIATVDRAIGALGAKIV